MTPQIITYIVCFITLGYLAVNLFLYLRHKNNGSGFTFRPVYLIVTLIVFLLSVYAIATGQTYDDIVTKINDMF
ncbi:hypothetical protein [Clostridium sp. KNHs205]|jgi:hypothetical protein|uniref:hypothetical protein n=1 Tax=Clostridium sp. KNHs205 TaxID=1449050 RepID=UPI00051C85D3|nr:hypothetical protein [Clostridium sp. KNHs205]